MNCRLRTSLAVAALGAVLAPSAFAQIVINETVYDNAGTDTATWVELKGPAGMSLDGIELVGINGNGGAVTQTINLSGNVIPADGYFVVGQSAAVVNVDFIGNTDFQNGPDSIVLRFTGGANIDALGYGTFGGTDIFAGEGSPAPDPTNDQSLARCPDGSDTNDNSVDFIVDVTATPGTPNDGTCAPPTPTDRTLCEIAADGSDGSPLLLNELVRVVGTVISPSGVFSTTTNDVKITDGECCVTIFGGAPTTLNVGDEVEVIGTVAFFNGLTELSDPFLDINVLSTGNPIPAPQIVTTADFAANGESYESCLIGFVCVDIMGGTWPPSGSDANITVDDGSGPAIMRIDRDTNIDGSSEPTASFSVIGVGGQFDNSSPYNSGYQMFPRFLSDLDLDDPACADPTGACCFADCVCVLVTELECGLSGGTWMGEGSTCDPNPCDCPPATGACCLPDGSCTILTADECGLANGTYLGDNTSCDGAVCPQPVGACCFTDCACLILSETDCAASGGAWLGAGTTCDPNPCDCPPPTGACCFADGSCMVLTADECNASGGSYFGDGVECAPTLCPSTPTIEKSWGQIKNEYRR